jgi:hypothetical protein
MKGICKHKGQWYFCRKANDNTVRFGRYVFYLYEVECFYPENSKEYEEIKNKELQA